jgi:hypothetical protein
MNTAGQHIPISIEDLKAKKVTPGTSIRVKKKRYITENG